MDPKLLFPDLDPATALISDPDSELDCLRKIHLNCRLSILRKKAILKICTFLQLCICYLETELNMNPDPKLTTNSDPNWQIISVPAGSGFKTLISTAYHFAVAQKLHIL